jgi:dTDP-4-amino-4,6-dideoxygalactose transaminase
MSYNNFLEKQNVLQLPEISKDKVNVFHQYTLLVKENSNFSKKYIQEKLLKK